MADGTMFIATGDIPAMWLRDSTWQVRPLLAMQPCAEVLTFLSAVSRRQARYLLVDPYANAFNPRPDGACWHRDFADQDPWVFERKFEVDSLAAFLDLGMRIWHQTGYREHLDAEFWRAAAVAVEVAAAQAHHDPMSYRFIRPGAVAHDVLANDGYGAPSAPNGMVWSGFRPSDDRCMLPYLVPANAHLAVVLGWLAGDPMCPTDLAAKAHEVATGIRRAIDQLPRPDGVLPFEVDGLGGLVLLDDPNVPSLLSLPYLGWCRSDDEDYRVTRSWVLSEANPNYVRSDRMSGLASEHTPAGWVWPLSIAIRGLTAVDDDEREACLDTLERCDGGTGYQHESVNPEDPRQFTRSWFSWADMTYVQLALAQIGCGEK